MKKSLLAMLFAVALAVPAMAEGMWIGGSLGYETVSPNGGDSSTSYVIAPEFGYSLNDSWDIGIQVSYASDENTFEVFGQIAPIPAADNVKTMGIAPFARYKLMTIGGVDVLAKGTLFYGSAKLDQTDAEVTALSFTVAPVIEYAINDAWSISATLNFAEIGYSNIKADKGDYEVSSFGFNVNGGTLMNVGVAYHF